MFLQHFFGCTFCEKVQLAQKDVGQKTHKMERFKIDLFEIF